MKLNRFIQKIKRFVGDSDYRFLILSTRGFYKSMDDAEYLKRKFKATFRRELDLDNTKTYNEKLQWLKLYNRKDEYTTLVDKYAVKSYVGKIIGEEYIIPTLGVWDSFDEIDFDKLPNQFVLKCTHDSGGLVICKDKSSLDYAKAKKKINKCLNTNFYYLSREWPYKNVKPRIIAEQYMEEEINGEKTGELKDYKLYCFNGKEKFMMVAYDRFSSEKTKVIYYDRDYKKIDLSCWGHEIGTGDIEKPEKYETMVSLAEKLSKDIPQVRIDFYVVNNNIYFGEITLYDGGGFDLIEPYEMDLKFGEYIELPEKINKEEA